MAGIELIHFIDADNGWAEANGFGRNADGKIIWGDVLLRTSDGGESWRRVEPPGILHAAIGHQRQRTHFVSSLVGWKLGADKPHDAKPNLVDDIEFYHSIDGGLTWQLR